MSGTIVFNYRCEWSASSGTFNWVNEFLIGRVGPGSDREMLLLIDDQNFRWLELARLSEIGAAQVLAALRTELVPYSEENLPDTPHREDVMKALRELAGIASSGPKRDVDVVRLDIVGKVITKATRLARGVDVELNGDPQLGFKLEGPYTVRHAGQVWDMEPEHDDAGRVQSCFEPLCRIPIRRAIAERTGKLWVSFMGRATLECGPGIERGPWTYRGAEDTRVWSLPGGGLRVLNPQESSAGSEG